MIPPPPPRKWIFVTGMPRSGTTFVGTTLSHSWYSSYIHEPFNAQVGIAGCDWSQDILFDEQFHPVNEHVRYAIHRLLQYRVRLKKFDSHNDQGWHRFLKKFTGGRGPVNLALAKMNPFAKVCILKDPIGWFYLPYLADKYGMRSVVVIKHPVSMVASFKRADWRASPQDFKRLKGLERWLNSDDLAIIENPPEDPSIAAAWQWRLTYKPLLKWSQDFSGVKVVAIEDLSKEPVPKLRSLFKNLDIDFSNGIQRFIENRTNAGNAEARPNKFQDLKRKSGEIFNLRRSSVPKEIRESIFHITADIGKHYYDRESYGI